MKTLVSCAVAVIAAAAIACTQQDHRSTISSDRGGGASTGAPGPTTLVGCLEAGNRAGAFRLRALSDATDRQGANSPTSGTSGSTGQPDRRSSSTTGLGGDAIRNAPTIGGGAISGTYDLVLSDSNTQNLERNIGARVSVIGVIEDNASGAAGGETTQGEPHTIRASSIAKLADTCSARR